MRLKDRVAIVVGAGQSPGEGVGNGRATALTFAREGAKVLCVDHNLASAQETADMISEKQGTALAFKADVTKNAEIKAMIDEANKPLGPHRRAAQQCRRQPRRRRRRTRQDHRGSVRPLRRHQPEELHPGRQARDPDHASAEERRDHQHLVDGGDHHLPLRRLQGDQGGDGFVHRTARLPERAVRHPRQRHPAGTDEHADGGGYARA